MLLRYTNYDLVVQHESDEVSERTMKQKRIIFFFLISMKTCFFLKYKSTIVGQKSHSLTRTDLKILVCPTIGSGVTG